MPNKMLIDATHPEETRVVVLRGNRVEEFDFETAQRKQLRGNIYLAKVTRVEPSLQAAFVDYGGNRHGFLAFSEIHPDYYQIPVADRQALIDADARAARDEDDEAEARGRRGSGRDRRPRPMRARNRGESVQGDAPAHDEAAAENAQENAQDAAGDAPFEAAPESAAPGGDAPTADVPFEAAPAPIGESANPPVAGEVASTYEPAQPTYEQAYAPPYAETNGTAGASQEAAASEPQDASAVSEPGAPAEDGQPVAAAEPDGNGHGDEEEEIVDTVGGADAMEEVMERAPRYRRQYKIQEVIKRRQVMLVQVVKEERGTKGAALTTYLSLAGRYCVLMPNTARGGGISRKITSSEDRKKLREIAEELEVPEGMGVILRTAGAARTKAEVKRDFEYLLRLWEQVRDLTLKSTAPTLVYEEGSLAKRSIRDLYAKDIDEIVVAGEQGYKDAKEFMRMLMPSHAKNVKQYRDAQPIFTRYGIESQLDAMFSPTVQLKSGGYIVLNQTEALVSIDVNSGRSTREHHIEDTALKTNCEAAEEVARQLRLRDLAGLIVIDFIDMDEKRNNRTVERRLKDALRNDRARIQVGRISHFGLLEMSRQRIRTSVLESSTEKCPHCGGSGHMRSVSSVALQLLRSIEETLLKGATHNLVVRTRPEIALYALNHKRAHLRALEDRFKIAITIDADAEVGGQTGFAIERGEQVHTPEQARALLAQSETAPAIVEEEEPEVAEEIGEETEADGSEGAEAPETESAEADAVQAEGETGREAGRRRRRRRRRGRGRGGEGRDSGRDLGRDLGRDPGQPAHHDNGGPRHTEFAPDSMGGMPQPGGDDRPAAGGAEYGEPFAPGHQNGSDVHADGDGNGDSERRRRRHGRRGGRRNRRDRDDQAPGEFAAGPGQQDRETHAAHPDDTQRAPWREAADSQPRWSEPAPVPDIAQAEMPPRIEPPAAAAASAPVVPPPAPEPARRRSTVREPAPLFVTGEPAVTPMPSPQPAPPSPAASEQAADDAGKPRRTGWWARRMMGGDKG